MTTPDAINHWQNLEARDVAALAPEAVSGFAAAIGAVAGVPDPVLAELLRLRIATLLQLPSDLMPPLADVSAAKAALLPQWPAAGEFTAVQRAALGFAEQFVIDVSQVDASQRGELTEAFGGDAFLVVQAIYLLDHGARLIATLQAVFGVPVIPRAQAPEGGLWPALESMMAAVARLQSVDPLTAELVRLRGARFHHCRLCSSRRRLSAVEADAALLELTDPMADPTLTPQQRAALALTDAMLLRPGAIGAEVIESVRRHLTPEQALEVALLVAHNAANKIAVALGADAPNVTAGLEFYELDGAGGYTYGLAGP